ncbi:hypothetical protein [Lacrimispora xylanisolvens]|uniref:hypothetical protein n=1 Tax=Lacrimispora xylanisolvens TaxID=384636 RepID=UPI002402D05C|nr:hypothetical protein [uncultured Clostridium sp.]
MHFSDGTYYSAVRDGWVTSFQVIGRNPDGTFDIRWLEGSISSAHKVEMVEWVDAYESLHKK